MSAITHILTTGNHVVLVGGGGHALVVAESVILSGARIRGVCDDAQSPPLCASDHLTGSKPIARIGGLHAHDADPGVAWIVCVGEVPVRRTVIESWGSCATQAASVAHPRAILSASARIGRGVWIGPGAIINPRASIEDHAIINSGAIIEHDCVVGANTHIAPGAILAGGAHVGADCLVGAGASVLPGAHIGANTTVGAGAVVTTNVREGAIVVGIPAKER